MVKVLVEKHVRAIELRKQGWSYSAIKNELKISKSTASMWLRHLPLSQKQLDALLFHNEHRIERFRTTMAKKKEIAFNLALRAQKGQIGTLTQREIYLCGLALYWSEGSKTTYSKLIFSNTDPRMIKFYLVWLKLGVVYPLERIRIKLHLYMDMCVEDETHYWMGVTGLRASQFVKPYIKTTTLRGITYKTRGHGTCNIIASGLQYARPALAGMEVLAEYFR